MCWCGKVVVLVGRVCLVPATVAHVGACGCPVIRHGQTSTGRQRWRYKLCQITTLNDIDSTAKHLDEFVAWEALVPTNGDQAQPQGTATEHDADR